MSTDTIERVETERMLLERLTPDHAAELVRLLLDPRVRAWLWPRGELPTEADVLVDLAAKVEHWRRHGFGLWLMRDLQTGEMVGRGGLQYAYVDGRREVEAAWATLPERWGQGLATELAGACVEVAFAKLELEEIVAFTLPRNIASRRVMENAGFTYVGDTIHAGLRHVLYRRRP